MFNESRFAVAVPRQVWVVNLHNFVFTIFNYWLSIFIEEVMDSSISVVASELSVPLALFVFALVCAERPNLFS